MKTTNELQSTSAASSRKSYRKPTTATHAISMESIIATSPGGTSGSGGNIPWGAPGFRRNSTQNTFGTDAFGE